MPGLKVIADRLPEMPRPRHVAFYTTSFTAGLEPVVLDRWGAGLARLVADGGALHGARAGRRVAARRVAAAARSGRRGAARDRGHALARGVRVCRHDALRDWILGAHVGAVRTARVGRPVRDLVRVVAGTPPPPDRGSTIAALVALVGVPASLAGAELTARVERRRLIVTVMIASVAASLLVLPSALVSWPLVILAVVVYSALISADSAALTSGILHVAPAASRGTAMAVYSTLGFAAASAGTFAVGCVTGPDGRAIGRRAGDSPSP